MISVIANGFYLNEYKKLNLSGLKEAECFEVLDVQVLPMYQNGAFKENVELILLQKPLWLKDEEVWNGKWGNNSPEWTYALREQHNLDDKTAKGQFYMPFSEYLKLIKSTDVSFDQLNTEDYQIVSAVTDMTKKTSIFFEFELKNNVNPRNENFAIIVEQLGNRLQSLMIPDNNHARFNPSAFNVILMYIGKDINKPKTQIIQALFGSKFKLTMIVNDALKRGKYTILVSPVWD